MVDASNADSTSSLAWSALSLPCPEKPVSPHSHATWGSLYLLWQLQHWICLTLESPKSTLQCFYSASTSTTAASVALVKHRIGPWTDTIWDGYLGRPGKKFFLKEAWKRKLFRPRVGKRMMTFKSVLFLNSFSATYNCCNEHYYKGLRFLNGTVCCEAQCSAVLESVK